MSDIFPQHPRLTTDRSPLVLVGEAVGFLRMLAGGCKPRRMLQSVVLPEDRAHILLHCMDEACSQRSASLAFLERKVDLEAVGILIAHPTPGEHLGRPMAIARQIPGAGNIRRHSRKPTAGGGPSQQSRGWFG